MISEDHPHYKDLSSSKMRGESYSPKSKTSLQSHPGEPRLSGELNSGRTNDSSSSSRDGDTFDEKKSDEAPPQHKKQVRRRFHTTRPCQERILNMAEARREIVAALKFHRNARKQTGEKQRREQEGGGLGPEGQALGPLSHQLSSNQEAMVKSNLQGYCSPCSWSVSPVPPRQFVHENLNFVLPSQTLGLNLNLEDFNCLDTDAFHCRKKPCSIFSSSSSSSPLSATADEIPCMRVPISAAAEVNQSGDWGSSHHAMDDKELAEIKSIGEQHQMEWDDTLNLVNSAWWFNFSKTMEIERNDNGKCEDLPFDEVMEEFPAWLLNAKDENCSEHVNGFCPEYDFPALPCMDFSFIEGMDGDWLA